MTIEIDFDPTLVSLINNTTYYHSYPSQRNVQMFVCDEYTIESQDKNTGVLVWFIGLGYTPGRHL